MTPKRMVGEVPALPALIALSAHTMTSAQRDVVDALRFAAQDDTALTRAHIEEARLKLTTADAGLLNILSRLGQE